MPYTTFDNSSALPALGHYDAVRAIERRIEVSAGAVEGVAGVEHERCWNRSNGLLDWTY